MFCVYCEKCMCLCELPKRKLQIITSKVCIYSHDPGETFFTMIIMLLPAKTEKIYLLIFSSNSEVF